MSDQHSKYWIVNKLSDNVAEILIYGDIGNYGESCVSASLFVKELKALEKDHPRINLRVNSGGGSVYEGIAIFNAIRNSKCVIDGYIDGLAASMASLIVMACNKVYMSKYASLMTHLPSGGAWGTAAELRATADQIDACAAVGNKMYQQKTGLSEAEVSSKFLNGKDNYFDADTALKEKLIDGIYDGEEVALPNNITDKASVWNAYKSQLSASTTSKHISNSIIILS